MAKSWRHATPRRHHGASPPSGSILLCRHPTAAKPGGHETPRRHHGRPVPAPEEERSLWPLGHQKKTDGLWWVGVWCLFLETALPGRAFAPLWLSAQGRWVVSVIERRSRVLCRRAMHGSMIQAGYGSKYVLVYSLSELHNTFRLYGPVRSRSPDRARVKTWQEIKLRPSRRREAATVTTMVASSSRSDGHHAIVATRSDDSDRLVAAKRRPGDRHDITTSSSTGPIFCGPSLSKMRGTSDFGAH